jgi:hypothetical protein
VLSGCLLRIQKQAAAHNLEHFRFHTKTIETHRGFSVKKAALSDSPPYSLEAKML